MYVLAGVKKSGLFVFVFFFVCSSYTRVFFQSPRKSQDSFARIENVCTACSRKIDWKRSDVLFSANGLNQLIVLRCLSFMSRHINANAVFVQKLFISVLDPFIVFRFIGLQVRSSRPVVNIFIMMCKFFLCF